MKRAGVKKSKVLNKYAKKNPVLAIILVFFGIISGFFFGIDDQAAINFYVLKLQNLSEHKLHTEQVVPLKIFYLQNNNRHPVKNSRHKVRKEFNRLKPSLKREWETRYRMVWPNLLLTKKGIAKNFAFEAHHIIPINAGGINRWWNITPLSPKNHKLLHSSMEEKACFSHDFLEQKYCRLVLMIKLRFNDIFSKKSVIRSGRVFWENFVKQIQ